MKLNLKEDERIIIILRATKLILAWPAVLGATLIFLSIFLFIPLFSFGLTGVIIFWLAIASGLLYALTKFWFWIRNQVIITNKKIVDIYQRKFFDVVVSEAPFYEVDDISFRQKGVWAHIFNYGNLTINFKNSKVILEIKKIHDPAGTSSILQDIKNTLASADISTIERMIEKFSTLGETERKALLHSLSEFEKNPKD